MFHLVQVIIEHTSSNPNAPLHIGNLRNVMIGATACRRANRYTRATRRNGSHATNHIKPAA